MIASRENSSCSQLSLSIQLSKKWLRSQIYIQVWLCEWRGLRIKTMVRKGRLSMPSHPSYSYLLSREQHWVIPCLLWWVRNWRSYRSHKVPLDSHSPLGPCVDSLSLCLPTMGGRMLCSAEFVHSWIYVKIPRKYLKNFDSNKLYCLLFSLSWLKCFHF